MAGAAFAPGFSVAEVAANASDRRHKKWVKTHTKESEKTMRISPSISKKKEFWNFSINLRRRQQRKLKSQQKQLQQQKGPGNNPLNCENCRKTATKERENGKERGKEGKVDSREACSLFIELSSVSAFCFCS